MAELKDISAVSKSLSILVMDPNSATSKHLVDNLKTVFLHVDETSSPYEGVNLCKVNRYDIILLDQEVPHIESAQIIKNFLAISSSIQVLYFTHNDSVEKLLEISNLDIGAIVSKPMNISLFYEQLKRVCDKANRVDMSDSSVHVKSNAILNNESLVQDIKSKKEKISALISKNKELVNYSEVITQEVNKAKYFNSVTNIENKHSLLHALKQTGLKALIYLNINHFDSINTLYGMGIGNKVLKATVEKLAYFLPDNAKLFNVNVDEFVVLLIEPKAEQELILADQISSMFNATPLHVDTHEFNIKFSKGVARGTSLELFVQSKIASKESKYYGGNSTTVFARNSDYLEKQRKDLFWMKTLKLALDEERIISYYQPIVNNESNAINHFEVLCRLKKADGTIVSAAHFISAAQEVGLVTQLSRIVFDQAFKHFSKNSYKFSLNICHEDLYENYLVDLIEYKCDFYGINPSRVHLELVGESSLENSDIVLNQIAKLKEMGIHIGVDDVNMDYSVFSRMLRLNVDYIKIDKHFTKDIAENSSNQNMVGVIVEFAKKSGMKTVAEHVETHAELSMISNLGVDFSQGYFIGKPYHDTSIRNIQLN